MFEHREYQLKYWYPLSDFTLFFTNDRSPLIVSSFDNIFQGLNNFYSNLLMNSKIVMEQVVF